MVDLVRAREESVLGYVSCQQQAKEDCSANFRIRIAENDNELFRLHRCMKDVCLKLLLSLPSNAV